MAIDNLTPSLLYVEKKKIINIPINSKSNSNGILMQDELGNQLISIIDTGDTPLQRVRGYEGQDGIMLFNSTTKHLQIVQDGDSLDIPIDFIKGTRYFLGAKRIVSTSVDGNTFTVPLDGLQIFKVYLDNGEEIINYTQDLNTIEIRGLQRQYIDDFSRLIVFAYKDNHIQDDMTNITIEYLGFKTIFDIDSFLNGDYFEPSLGFLGREIVCSEGFQVNETVEKETFRRGFNYNDGYVVKHIQNTIDFETFESSFHTDIIQYVSNQEFRIIYVNPLTGRTVLFNNCVVSNGVNLSFQKEKNIKRFSITCGNYIDIRHGETETYGEGKYGEGLYSGYWAYNSHRKGANL